VPVRQSAQAVLLYQKRIARWSDLCRAQCHHTSKNSFGHQKMITKNILSKNIVAFAVIFKMIVRDACGEVKTGGVLKK
jgi:hypothetical protein